VYRRSLTPGRARVALSTISVGRGPGVLNRVFGFSGRLAEGRFLLSFPGKYTAHMAFGDTQLAGDGASGLLGVAARAAMILRSASRSTERGRPSLIPLARARARPAPP
jgi:hypothetical protein